VAEPIQIDPELYQKPAFLTFGNACDRIAGAELATRRIYQTLGARLRLGRAAANPIGRNKLMTILLLRPGPSGPGGAAAALSSPVKLNKRKRRS
jgi:hypothetical protein